MLMYVAVIEVNKVFANNTGADQGEIKDCLDAIIKLTLGYRGKIIGSEIVDGSEIKDGEIEGGKIWEKPGKN